MTRTEFDPVYTFLMDKQGSLKPFYVYLPQYRYPKNTDFSTWLTTYQSSLVPDVNVIAGSTTMMIESENWDIDSLYISNPTPLPGDLFNVVDSNDGTHTKTYMITRVETADTYRTGITAPTDTVMAQYRIHFTPGLKADVQASTTYLRFNEPKIHVFQKNDIQEYSLGNNNLYSFSLNLEEAIL